MPTGLADPALRDRYSRQIGLAAIGEKGQQTLLDSTAMLIGMGGLGSPAAMYLAAAGVGRLVISDFDRVENSNLQRQIIHRHPDIGELKTRSAQHTLNEINPQCRVELLDWQLDEEELFNTVARADVVLDCSDNFPTRFALNRACFKAAVPLVSGAAIRTEGQIASYLFGHLDKETQTAKEGPCYQCLYPSGLENAPSCDQEGILAPVAGVIGTLQALQAILVLLGETEGLHGKLLLFDALQMDWRSIHVTRNPNCPVCGKGS